MVTGPGEKTGCRQGCREISRGCGILCGHVRDFNCKSWAKNTFTLNNVKKRLPILGWLPNYNLQCLYGDMIAGLTVGLTVIPQSLALAGLAELPPQYGLYSAFMGCFVYCFLGSSKDITLGPTAIMSLLTAEFAKSPVHNDATIAVVLTLFCGIIQLAMGIFKLGFLVDFISHPVITGFTTAAAITIAFSQVKTWWGITSSISRSFIPRVIQTIKYGIVKKETKLGDLFLGLGIMVILYLMKRMKNIQWRNREVSVGVTIFRKAIWLLGTARNALVVLLTAMVAGILHSKGLHPFTLTSHIESGLPKFRAPSFHVACMGNISDASHTDVNATAAPHEHEDCDYGPSLIFSTIGSGFAIIPLLGIVETIAIAKAFARKNQYRIDPTQEFIAMGVANIMSCFVQAYPVTGSFSRTAVNSQSGVRTPAGGIFTGGLVLLALGVLTPYFRYIPSAALACVIIMAVIDMVDFGVVCRLIQVKPIDLFPWFVTFLLSFIIGIEYGILLGVAVSMLMLMYPWARPALKVSRKDQSPEGVPDEVQQRQAIVIQLDQGMYFPGMEYITRRILEEANADGSPHCVILDLFHVANIDYSAVQGLHALAVDCHLQNITLVLVNVQPPVLHVLEKANCKGLQHFTTVDDALQSLQEQGQLTEDNQRQGLLSGISQPSYTSPDGVARGSHHSVNREESPTSGTGSSHHSNEDLPGSRNDVTVNVDDEEDIENAASPLRPPV